MPPGFPAGFGGGMPGAFPGFGGPPQLAALQNPKVLDALVRSGRFRTREEAQAWIGQMLAMATQAGAQQAPFSEMQTGTWVDGQQVSGGTWVNGQQVSGQMPGAGQQTFQDLMDQARQKRNKGRGN
jgi:hypothetical protein